MTKARSQELPFKPRARMLAHFGDQLIRDAGIAVFELVKNAYDADAIKVEVLLSNVQDESSGEIVIRDNGCGMTWDIVTQVWLEPGTDYREIQKEGGYRTEKYGRTPLGEKGIGRFAAHKLGQRILLVTRAKGGLEVVVDIDWRDFLGDGYLDQVPIKVFERPPQVFKGNKTGTTITVTDLWSEWTRATARHLYRAVNSIRSPFKEPGNFVTDFVMEPDVGWFTGLLDIRSVMDLAPHQGTARLSSEKIEYDYEFRPPAGMNRVAGRTETGKTVYLPIDEATDIEARKALGNFIFDIHIFDLDAYVLEFATSDKRGLKQFMRENGGVRVYRDGVRVFDYGEPGNDWLELGTRRVNIPASRVSNNLLIGAVHLDAATSKALKEKTNREGFVENNAYHEFKEMVFFALVQMEAERNRDKARVRSEYSSKHLKEPVLAEIEELREILSKRELIDELGPIITRIENQFRDVRDTLLTAAGPGLTLAVVIHEVEKGIVSISSAIRRDAPLNELKELSTHLEELIDGLTYLTRRSGKKKEKAENLIRQAIFNSNYRFQAHNIKVTDGTERNDPKFSVTCTRRLIVASLMNLIDNSIYWLDNKGAKDKSIYVGTTSELEGGPALVVADNGPGFSDPPEYLIEPFITRRPDGMGLGLHVVSEVMKVHQGKLLFPQKGDVKLPRKYTGAIVALQFPRK